MFNSFSSALSALKAHSAAVDTVGHNLANVNTTGFKGTDIAFKDLVAQSMGGGKNEVGMGVNRPITVRNFSQGAVQTTSGALDAAIQGSGFFVVVGVEGSRLLTRDGSFQLDRSGYVTTLTGERVQQYKDGVLSDIQVPAGASPAKQTGSVSITANLNATADVDATFSQPVEVVDSLGVTHVVTLRYTKTDANQWKIEALIPGNEIDAESNALTPLTIEPADTALAFDEAGKLDAEAPESFAITLEGLTSEAADMTITYRLRDASGNPLITQFAQASAASKTDQDGYPAAEVVSVGMADGGRIIAEYGNGEQKEIGTLALAVTANPSSLTAVGNNMFRASIDTSAPTYGVAGTGGRGKVKAGSLESSTVDMAREFTNLIVFQRGYQANSRVITTADEMSQETLNLKR